MFIDVHAHAYRKPTPFVANFPTIEQVIAQCLDYMMPGEAFARVNPAALCGRARAPQSGEGGHGPPARERPTPYRWSNAMNFLRFFAAAPAAAPARCPAP